MLGQYVHAKSALCTYNPEPQHEALPTTKQIRESSNARDNYVDSRYTL